MITITELSFKLVMLGIFLFGSSAGVIAVLAVYYWYRFRGYKGIYMDDKKIGGYKDWTK